MRKLVQIMRLSVNHADHKIWLLQLAK